MHRFTFALLALLFAASGLYGQEMKSPYAGEQVREITSLSPQQIQGYLSGHGMGLAKAAELNHHPGPKHVLESAKELKLTELQKRQTQEIYDDMHRQAIQLGKRYIHLEQELDRLFAEGNVDEEKLRTQISKISEIQGKLRFVHLNAHLKMLEVLTEEQIERYDVSRGYRNHQHPKAHKKHH
ncbi:periplasmic heavy metal sensor [candidate division KSB1 bacterium]|nr:periplasmic heavy metal sensor [candidate division KSB1 bacterium]NIR71082.1 periplasmic heavy metal sensor [candidate division KSB1 bacterium]NIS27892.1 periplasmic heavy metal sensor [candidate division KSB1 bacterium]NIT74775.1 periplasmic heavy metal sensor [candidate division KSB1 bacterium]NIU28552.1 periplasmic heavy metal sensor [candidate division KSB1 bacterium]